MGTVIIQEETTKNPISLIGKEAGICWGANTSNQEKNYKRGLECIHNNHGRTMEFPDVYLILDGYSARVIREFYTHIGGAPTRLQASTRYINYNDFNVICPPSIRSNRNREVWEAWVSATKEIQKALLTLEACGVPREDAAMLLPLGMETKVVVKINSRTLTDMSRQRMCTRAYWEFRLLFNDICKALSDYSDEWAVFVKENFMAKCDYCGYCVESHSCGKRPSKEQFFNTYKTAIVTSDAIKSHI